MDRGLTRAARYLWAAPITFVGIAIAIAAWPRAHVALVDGVIEVQGPWLRLALRHLVPLRGGAAAITFGHVVLARDQASLDFTRAHERVHVRQYERWGVFFFPLYVASSVAQLIRGRHPYLDNAFEREAYAKSAARPDA